MPAALAERWSKARRFDEAWRLVRALRPARALTSRRARLEDAQAAFEALDAGEETAVQFEYGAHDAET